MDWPAFGLSLRLAAWTLAILVPIGLVAGRWIAWSEFRGRPFAEAALALPLVLPPTVLGFYLLQALGGGAPLGALAERLFGEPLVFNFSGLLVASIVFNLPFAIQPIQRAFEAIDPEVREAAQCCGLSRWQAFRGIELPLVLPGLLSAVVLTFAHTLGEFGVVLMVGGSIPGETRTVAIAIYDRVQAFDSQAAALMSATLLAISFAAMVVVYATTGRRVRRR